MQVVCANMTVQHKLGWVATRCSNCRVAIYHETQPRIRHAKDGLGGLNASLGLPIGSWQARTHRLMHKPVRLCKLTELMGLELRTVITYHSVGYSKSCKHILKFRDH